MNYTGSMDQLTKLENVLYIVVLHKRT